MNKQKRKYQQILSAAVSVFAQYGYHRAQVSKIAEMANVADGTIYLYFKNKEDLLIAVFEEKIGHFIDCIEEGIMKETNVLDQLYRLVDLHLSLLESKPDLAVVTQLELRQSKYVIQEKLNRILQKYFNLIDSIILKGQEEQIISERIEKYVVRNMIFGTLDQTVTSWVISEQTYSLHEQAGQIKQLLLQGLVNYR